MIAFRNGERERATLQAGPAPHRLGGHHARPTLVVVDRRNGLTLADAACENEVPGLPQPSEFVESRIAASVPLGSGGPQIKRQVDVVVADRSGARGFSSLGFARTGAGGDAGIRD